MDRVLTIVMVLLTFFSCTSGPQLEHPKQIPAGTSLIIPCTTGYISSVPDSGGFVIIGAASPNASQDKILTGYTARTWQIGEKSINAALLDAARRLSIYVKGVSGEFSTAIRTTPSIFDYVNGTDSSLTLTEQDYAHYITDFEFDLQKDVFIINDVIFVRVHYSKANPVSLSFVPSFTSGRPKWIEKAPEFKGYVTGIGFANPTTDSYAPGVITSYENAVFDIVRQKSFS